MGALRKTMEYLGLTEMKDEYEDDYYEEEDVHEAEQPRRTDIGGVTHLPQRTPIARVVRDPEVGPLSRITTMDPRAYNDARAIGEAFREGIPVIMNLTEVDDVEAKRLVDFASGLTFGLRGSIDRVAHKVFLLTPEEVFVEGGSAFSPDTPFNHS